MLFFKMEGTSAETENPGGRQKPDPEKVQSLRLLSEKFDREQHTGFFFISNILGNSVTAGLVTECGEAAAEDFGRYFEALELELTDLHMTEIAYWKLEGLLHTARRCGFVEDLSETMHRLRLNTLGEKCGQDEVQEELLEDTDRGQAEAVAEECFMQDTYLPEIGRICAGKADTGAVGHPVYYLVETDDPEIREKVCVSLLGMLYENGRLRSRRYNIVDLDSCPSFSTMDIDGLYESARGGSVVLISTAAEKQGNSPEAAYGSRLVFRFCRAVRKYKNQVLTVFCLPRSCTRTKTGLFEELGGIRMVELTEELVQGQRAKNALRQLAEEAGTEPDEKLFSMVEEDKTYLAPDLADLFDRWYSRKLRSDIYPQYAHLAGAADAVATAAPKGSAYEELQKMIGLKSAKEVIGKALSYCKVQKLYGEKGFSREHPGMHMVFTGAPGTAKTTVARLFARIMRENGLLSTGDLVEVGRADLVGKYVGWTAKAVREKFQQARGGVLFIDEAYSLVDGSHSFGDEAINTIVQEMENCREDTVVIFAGYPRPMEEFLRKNPGLRSRIAFQVPFEDYDTRELCDIARLRSTEKGFHLTDRAMEKLAGIFDAARKREDFGNGRYVRTVLERARMNQADRLLKMEFDSITADTVATLLPEDLEAPEPSAVPRRNAIGFAT